MKQLETDKSDSTGQNTEDETRITNVQEEAYKRFLEKTGETLKVIQMENHYPDVEGGKHYHPLWVNKDLKDWQPKYTSLKLIWTYSGRWVKVPIWRDTRTEYGQDIG